jgi:hypothetical protein
MAEYRESEASRTATAGIIRPFQSGWSRLFVVIAALWTVFVPIYFMVSSNNSASASYSSCYSLAYSTWGPGSSIANDAKLQARLDECSRSFESSSMPYTKVLAALFPLPSPDANAPPRNADDILLTKVLWGFILVPIALLWIVGGGIIRTVRWIAAGFKG